MQNKILSFLRRNYPQIIFGTTRIIFVLKLSFSSNLMSLNETKNILTHEIIKELKKSKLEVLTNEKDFLVKNLKKAG